MWAIIVISITMMTGQANVIAPQSGVVTEAGTFDTEAACNAALAIAVPDKLDKDQKKLWQDGYRKFLCVRIRPLSAS